MKEPLLSSMPTLFKSTFKTEMATRPPSQQNTAPSQEKVSGAAAFTKRCKSCSLPNTSRFGRCSYCATPLNQPTWSPRLGMLLLAGTTLACMLWVTADEAWMLPTPPAMPSLSSITQAFKPISLPKLSLPKIYLPQLAGSLPKLPQLKVPPKAKGERPSASPMMPIAQPPGLQTPPLATTLPISKPEAATTPQASQSTGSALTCGGFPANKGMAEPNFGPYLAQVQQKIRAHWQPPKLDQSKHVVVLYRIACNGQLLQAKVQTSSGLPIADQAALSAIRQAAPFPALPATYTGKSVDVEFEFDYEMTRRKAQNTPPTQKK